jgi:hypothetical protein
MPMPCRKSKGVGCLDVPGLYQYERTGDGERGEKSVCRRGGKTGTGAEKWMKPWYLSMADETVSTMHTTWCWSE